MSPQEAVLRYYGLDKIAAPVASTLGTALRHGAYSAIPGAVLGSGIGFIHGGPNNPDGSGPTLQQRLGAAGKGALIGGAATGALGGVTSGAMQHGYADARHLLDTNPNGRQIVRNRMVERLQGQYAPAEARARANNLIDVAFQEPTWTRAIHAGSL